MAKDFYLAMGIAIMQIEFMHEKRSQGYEVLL